MRPYRCLAMCLLGVLLGGCLLSREEFRAVRLFDLGTPSPRPEAGLEVGDFYSTGPYRHKMIYRTGGQELQVDEYHHWAQPPAALVARHLGRVFPREAVPARRVVAGEIVVFEADMAAGEAVFEVNYVVREIADGRVVATGGRRYTAPLTAIGGAEFAAAMTVAVGQFADDLQRLAAASP